MSDETTVNECALAALHKQQVRVGKGRCCQMAQLGSRSSYCMVTTRRVGP